uniref:Uncharacterized protein n=1 Tax=blood disease bacterium R229 TaxID=741978 RepID=G2ZNG3_9RALS|nr:hypothetical protein BDB_110002 [blood disease bacterium R229]
MSSARRAVAVAPGGLPRWSVPIRTARPPPAAAAPGPGPPAPPRPRLCPPRRPPPEPAPPLRWPTASPRRFGVFFSVARAVLPGAVGTSGSSPPPPPPRCLGAMIGRGGPAARLWKSPLAPISTPASPIPPALPSPPPSDASRLPACSYPHTCDLGPLRPSPPQFPDGRTAPIWSPDGPSPYALLLQPNVLVLVRCSGHAPAFGFLRRRNPF